VHTIGDAKLELNHQI